MTPARFLLAVFVLLVEVALHAQQAQAQSPRRVALVVGIDAYAHLSKLEKAVNDARAVAQVLRDDLAFSTVITGENLDRNTMVRKLQELDTAIRPGDLVFFFFSGHGVAIGQDNILLPADMPKPGNGEDGIVRDHGFKVDDIMRRIQARGAATTILVLDACRDNPLAQAGTKNIGAMRGLTRVDAPQGMFVLFSAGLGQKSLDRLSTSDKSSTSVFTRHLVPALKTPCLSHVQIAKRVQQEVDATARDGAKHEQQPAYYDQIIGDIVFSCSRLQQIPQSLPLPVMKPNVFSAPPTSNPSPKLEKKAPVVTVPAPKQSTNQAELGQTTDVKVICAREKARPCTQFFLDSKPEQ